MTKKLTTIDVLGLTLSLLMLMLAAWIAIKGPSTPIPLHFDASGNADRYGSRYELAGVIVLMAVINLVSNLLIGRQVAATTDPIRAKGLRRGQCLSLLIIAGVAVYIPYASLGPDAWSGTTDLGMATVFTSVVFLIIGATVGRIGPNPFIGVRTPWAYKSRLAWDRSNRLAGRLFFIIGLAGLAGSLVLNTSALLICLVVGVLCASAWAAYESWRVWRNDPEAQPF